MHVNELSKNVGEQGHLQILVETFTGQATCWWGTHQPQLQTCTTTSTYFIERFRGKMHIDEANIIKFIPRNGPQEHIDNYEREWKRNGYRDERIWPHFFPSTLEYLPNKWYKSKEACGDTFTQQTLKQNFIKDFFFNTKEEKLKEATKHIKEFFKDPSRKKIDQDKTDQRPMDSCNQFIKDKNR